VPAIGASWIMMGMLRPSLRRPKKRSICFSPTRSVAPWYGGITITIAAPCACARWPRARQMSVEKWVVVTITGTRPATCSRISRVSVSRSSSPSTNCSEKLARMHRPLEPAAIMKSTQRFWPSRSRPPCSSKMVGTTGKTPW
jgi:hypothetical protein